MQQQQHQSLLTLGLCLILFCVFGIQGFISIPHYSERTTLHHSAFQQGLLRSNKQNDTDEGTTEGFRRGLYPPSNPFQTGSLLVGADGRIQHEVYYEVHGRTAADENINDTPLLTALFLHGGPGAGCFPNHARFFDPKVYRIVLMDQRGSGRSTPRGETTDNTLLDIVSDCELLRHQLDIAQWSVILGGSWGVSVAVAYAQEFPNHIQSIVLRGVCLFREMEIDWMFSSEGYAKHYPYVWDKFTNAVTNTNHDQDENGTCFKPRDTLYRYYDRLLGDNTSLRIKAARSWMEYEMQVFATSSRTDSHPIADAPVAVLKDSIWSYQDGSGNVLNKSSIIDKMGLPKQDITFESSLCEAASLPLLQEEEDTIALSPRPVQRVTEVNKDEAVDESSLFIPAQNILTCYYSVNRKLVMNGIDLLDPTRMKRIQHIPCIAVHGKNDLVCPVTTALELASVWPTMELRIPMLSGHSMYDIAIANELVRATDRMAQHLLIMCRLAAE